MFYRPPPGATVSTAGSARLDPLALLAVIVAGLIWGLYNVGFAMIFSFGPSLLAERGWSIAAAGSAGPIMSLAARVLVPETRAIGMGVFHTLFYGAMMLGPAVAGWLAKSAGTAAVALDLGAVAVLACPPLMWLFERIVSVRVRRTKS